MPTSSLRVFIIAADPSLRESLCSLLEAHLFAVLAFDSIDSFLARHGAERRLRGCLVLDLDAPGPGGSGALRSLDAAKTGLPLIVISGRHKRTAPAGAVPEGAVAFLDKPFPETALLDAIAVSSVRHEQTPQRLASPRP